MSSMSASCSAISFSFNIFIPLRHVATGSPDDRIGTTLCFLKFRAKATRADPARAARLLAAPGQQPRQRARRNAVVETENGFLDARRVSGRQRHGRVLAELGHDVG